MDSSSQLLLEGYHLERKLGSGGMGDVYLARDTISSRFYAVKMSQFTDRERQRRFLDELLLWIDIPSDPHIAACHFFRTSGAKVAIFSEFVEGGSLADWLTDREVSRLGNALDIGIMSARGIARIHGLNLVHQDIKSSNILIGLDGIAKVTDFGLARGVARTIYESATPEQIRISGHSNSFLYRSPEQAALRPVTAATDIWSWAVMMLEVFVGEITWRDGQVADEVLALIPSMWDDGECSILMPDSVYHILKRCLQIEPQNRWASMRDVENALLQVFRDTQQRDYPKNYSSIIDQPAVYKTAMRASGEFQKTFIAPLAWLRKARTEAGLSSEVAINIQPFDLSRKARSVALIVILEDARHVLETLVESGREDLRTLLAGLYAEKGLLHAEAWDDAGAVQLYDRAIKLFEGLADRDMAHDGLIQTLERKARSLLRLEKLEDAKIAVSEAIKLHKYSLSPVSIITVIALQAGILARRGSTRRALALQNLAISAAERLIAKEGRSEFRFWLASSYSEKALTLTLIGDRESAISCLNKAINQYERAATLTLFSERKSVVDGRDRLVKDCEFLIDPAGNGAQRLQLPLYTHAVFSDEERKIYSQLNPEAVFVHYMVAKADRAKLLSELGRPEAADHFLDIIEYLEIRIRHEAPRDSLRLLATAHANFANLVRLEQLKDTKMEHLENAVSHYDRTIEIYEELRLYDGDPLVEEALSVAWLDKASALALLRKDAEAHDLFEKSIAVLESLADTGLLHVRDKLAKAYVNGAVAASIYGRRSLAARLFDKAIGVYQRLAAEQDGNDVAADWAWAVATRGRFLNTETNSNDVSVARRIIEREAHLTGRVGLARLADTFKNDCRE